MPQKRFFSSSKAESSNSQSENNNVEQNHGQRQTPYPRASINKIASNSTSSLPDKILEHFEHFQILCMFRECAKLLIFDNIATDCQTPISIYKLSQLTNTNPQSLYRFLRALASFGYTKQIVSSVNTNTNTNTTTNNQEKSENSGNFEFDHELDFGSLLFIHTQKSIDCATFGRWYSALIYKSSQLNNVYFNNLFNYKHVVNC